MTILTPSDVATIVLTIKLASVTTLILLVIGTPLAYWLAMGQSRWRVVVGSVVALPLVLPPTVLGFYLLIGLGANSPIGQGLQALGLGGLPFSFSGLVVASVLYSMPFVVQPLYTAIAGLGRRQIEAALLLGASEVECFFRVVVPQIRAGVVTAAVLGFAHTVGEFGVVLMIGGNIPNETRVMSVQIYEYVETLDYARAHILSAWLLGFSFLVLLILYSIQYRGKPIRH